MLHTATFNAIQINIDLLAALQLPGREYNSMYLWSLEDKLHTLRQAQLEWSSEGGLDIQAM
jgi:hypothetical protein